MVQDLKEKYNGRVDVKIYRNGKDFEYIKKYGQLTTSMLVINEKKAITKLTKSTIIGAFEEALREC